MQSLSSRQKRWTLFAVSLVVFITAVDNTVVNVALPSIGRDLGLGQSALEWIVNGYILAFATLLLTGGRLGDLFGRRRAFLAGLAVSRAPRCSVGSPAPPRCSSAPACSRA